MHTSLVANALRVQADVLALPAVRGAGLGAVAMTADREIGGVLARALSDGDFTAQRDEIHATAGGGALAAKRVVLVGTGDGEPRDLEMLRRAGAALCLTQGMRAKIIAVAWDDLGIPAPAAAESAIAFVEGYDLASYEFDRFKSQKRAHAAALRLVTRSKKIKAVIDPALDRALASAAGVTTARDLSNLPANHGTPEVLAERARDLGRRLRLKVDVLGPRELEKKKMGAFLSVSLGSPVPPRLIVMQMNATKRGLPSVALVGKGLTFDSGGISIKPADGMEKMRHDKSGGAVVIGVMEAAARLHLPLRLIGIVPATENMPGGNANKPGDIVRAANGKTIEIINTDAEGRLALADALVHAQSFQADVVIDLATLTGACMVALGHHCAGLMTRDDRLARDLVRAGRAVHERLWRLPLWDDYADEMRGAASDLKNLAGRYGGALTAGAFLESFAGTQRWAHVDIAGVSWDDPARPYHRGKGATGFGVRLLLRYLETLAAGA
jgi:leucyl aminopeptidase